MKAEWCPESSQEKNSKKQLPVVCVLNQLNTYATRETRQTRYTRRAPKSLAQKWSHYTHTRKTRRKRDSTLNRDSRRDAGPRACISPAVDSYIEVDLQSTIGDNFFEISSNARTFTEKRQASKQAMKEEWNEICLTEQKTLLSLYPALEESLLNYCIISWGNKYQSTLQPSLNMGIDLLIVWYP